eukprot:TRINITY_DN14948_c0_g1::TRINITY_DN14948_c0_g1_i1::g.25725::m.25725 TRINITY_DN14948_c0_g1::TRINITY_DN14948_c0_g1_i1::g.25725  ORF type:complete len:188 (-),score=33.66,DUF872/PF05915.7/0.4,DUF872/PF05915.7/61,Polysacc_synt_3/PF13440.1/0.035,Polysacc_synt_3/PF13440.1/3e+02 TRINITY_DN14948_c0_g1_i1:1258-1821(-)
MARVSREVIACIVLLALGDLLYLIGFSRYMQTENEDPRYTSYYLATIFNSFTVALAVLCVLKDKQGLNVLFLFVSLVSLVAAGGVLNEQGQQVDYVDSEEDQGICEIYGWDHPYFCENVRLMFAGSFIYSFFLIILLLCSFGRAGGSGAWKGIPVPVDDNFGLDEFDLDDFVLPSEGSLFNRKQNKD